MNGQVLLTGGTQYVCALGKRGEAGEQPIKNREMRELEQKGNQACWSGFHCTIYASGNSADLTS